MKELILQDMHDLIKNPVEPVYLIDGIIEDQTTGAIFGESGAGKSFIAIDMACCVATGTPWAGHKVDMTGPVIYFAGEGKAGLGRRMASWSEYHQTEIPKGKIFIPEERVELDDVSAKRVIKSVDAIAKEHGSPKAIIVDTMARSMSPDCDENSNKDVQAFINRIDGIRAKYGAVAIIVHHTGHSSESSSRARGASAFRASMDFEYLVTKKGVFKCTKMKDAEEPDAKSFELKDCCGSAVVHYGKAATSSKITLNAEQKDALAILVGLSSTADRGVVYSDEWKSKYSETEKNSHKKKDTVRRVFSRAKKGLIENGKIVESDDGSLTIRTD